MTHKEFRALDKSTEVEWVEPFPGLTASGKRIDVTLKTRATVRDCIAIRRYVLQNTASGQKMKQSDKQNLEDFLVVNWATIVKE